MKGESFEIHLGIFSSPELGYSSYFLLGFPKRSNPTLPRPENTQITSSEKSVNQLTPTEDIVSEESSVSYDGKVFYGVIITPLDYQNRTLPTIVIEDGFNNTLEQYKKCSRPCHARATVQTMS